MVTVDFNRIKLFPDGRILDIGCGSGRHTAAAYRIPGVFVVGLDPADGELADARRRLEWHDRLSAHGGGRWSLCAADGLDLPFGDQRFDLVICCEVLEHIPNHRRAVAEIARVLRPGGHAVVSVPRYGPERLCWALSRDYAPVKGGHIRIYSKRRLTGLLEHAGLTPWAAHHAHSLHTPFWWLKCLMGPDRKEAGWVKLYRRFLTWDLMQRPRSTRFLERLLNPILGKSLVVYCKKPL
jgi:ubiquinone/menaquinone biosynthesis C-methylase UbiE